MKQAFNEQKLERYWAVSKLEPYHYTVCCPKIEVQTKKVKTLIKAQVKDKSTYHSVD